MAYERHDLEEMTLQRLAYILPQTPEEEAEVKEVFERRASVSRYETLTNVDVRLGWQEAILQKYVEERRASMAPENPATLTSEDQAKLDANVITKEIEMELQEKLDRKNKRTVESVEEPLVEEPVAEEPVAPEVPAIPTEEIKPKRKYTKKK